MFMKKNNSIKRMRLTASPWETNPNRASPSLMMTRLLIHLLSQKDDENNDSQIPTDKNNGLPEQAETKGG
jgi:hypothetical protein